VDLRIFTEPQQGASYQQLLAAALVTEDAGFGGFFRSDHYLRMGEASGLPAYTDAWVTLAGLARDTRSVRLGTLVTPATFRAVGTFPVLVAGVDHMSQGRLEVGLGAGWYEEEYHAYGLEFPSLSRRYDLLEDQLAILHGVWSAGAGGIFEHAGLTCKVRLETEPLRTFQQPHPPVIIGGRGGRRNARLAATFADEFNISFVSAEIAKAAYASVRAACEALGRDPGSLVWSSGQTICCGRSEQDVARRAKAIGRDPSELRENALAGSPAEVLERLGTFANAGVQRMYLQVLDLSDHDHLRLVAEEVMPFLPE